MGMDCARTSPGPVHFLGSLVARAEHFRTSPHYQRLFNGSSAAARACLAEGNDAIVGRVSLRIARPRAGVAVVGRRFAPAFALFKTARLAQSLHLPRRH